MKQANQIRYSLLDVQAIEEDGSRSFYDPMPILEWDVDQDGLATFKTFECTFSRKEYAIWDRIDNTLLVNKLGARNEEVLKVLRSCKENFSPTLDKYNRAICIYNLGDAK